MVRNDAVKTIYGATTTKRPWRQYTKVPAFRLSFVPTANWSTSPIVRNIDQLGRRKFWTKLRSLVVASHHGFTTVLMSPEASTSRCLRHYYHTTSLLSKIDSKLLLLTNCSVTVPHSCFTIFALLQENLHNNKSEEDSLPRQLTHASM